MQVFSPNFLIKVPKQQEADKREKLGNIYLHPSFVWMTRNTQCGIIENISPEANKQLPQAKIGDILIVHHFAQGSLSKLEPEKKHLVHEDEVFNYYKINGKEIAGLNNQCYGVYNGQTIIPHKDYVFLEKEHEHSDLDRDKIYARMEWLKNENEKLGKTGINNDRRDYILNNEKDISKLSKQLHKKEHITYKVAYANPSLGIKNGTIVFCLNISANTLIEFMGKEYRVVEKRYLSAINSFPE